MIVGIALDPRGYYIGHDKSLNLFFWSVDYQQWVPIKGPGHSAKENV